MDMGVSYVEHRLKFEQTLRRHHCAGIIVAVGLQHLITVSFEITHRGGGIIASDTESDKNQGSVGRTCHKIHYRRPDILAGMRENGSAVVIMAALQLDQAAVVAGYYGCLSSQINILLVNSRIFINFAYYIGKTGNRIYDFKDTNIMPKNHMQTKKL